MIRTIKIFAAISLLMLLAGQVKADDVRVSVQLDSAEFLIGDWIPLEISVEHPADIEVFAPEPTEDELGSIVFIGRTNFPVVRIEDNVREKWVLTLAAFDTASALVIPSFPGNYHTAGDSVIQSVMTEELTVSIYSAGGDTLSEIHGIKPQMSISRGFEDYLPFIFLVSLLVLASAGYFIWKKYFRKDAEENPEAEAKIKVDPFDKALRRITELKAKQLWEKGYVKEYFFETTEILREYIENEFSIPAMEMTSDDILFSEDILKILEKKDLEHFLRDADLVKFARYIPGSDECAFAVEKTYELVKMARARKPKPVYAGSVTDLIQAEPKSEIEDSTKAVEKTSIDRREKSLPKPPAVNDKSENQAADTHVISGESKGKEDV